jgi:hypothetical protein
LAAAAALAFNEKRLRRTVTRVKLGLAASRAERTTFWRHQPSAKREAIVGRRSAPLQTYALEPGGLVTKWQHPATSALEVQFVTTCELLSICPFVAIVYSGQPHARFVIKGIADAEVRGVFKGPQDEHQTGQGRQMKADGIGLSDIAMTLKDRSRFRPSCADKPVCHPVRDCRDAKHSLASSVGERENFWDTNFRSCSLADVRPPASSGTDDRIRATHAGYDIGDTLHWALRAEVC